MKTFLRIIVILMAASLVAGGFYITLNDTSFPSDSEHNGGAPSVARSDGYSSPLRERYDDDGRGEESPARGLGEMFTVIIRLALYTGIVLGVQILFNRPDNRKLRLEQ